MSTVLIVDDYPAVRKSLRRLLERLCSVVCIEATNGLDAIAKTEASHPDLIIMDISMPGMNGFEAASVLQKTMPQVPLFLFTSHQNRDVASQAASAGMRGVFQAKGYQCSCGRSERVVRRAAPAAHPLRGILRMTLPSIGDRPISALEMQESRSRCTATIATASAW